MHVQSVTGVLLDIDTVYPGVTTVKALDAEGYCVNALQKAIACDVIEHLTINVNGTAFDAWFDAFGKFKHRLPAILLEDDNGKLIDYIGGNIVITSSNTEGDTVGLTDDECIYVEKWLNEQHKKAVKWFFTQVQNQ